MFDRADVEWAIQSDYRLSGAFEAALRERRRLLVRQSRLAARAERERAEGGVLGAGAADRAQRAASEILRRVGDG